jgi:peptidoglycan/LPS O-acetylase OafA/YrhL
VISGYLITGIIVREIQATGRVGLLAFYARRIRRLLPAAFVVLAATLVLLVLVVPRVVWRENLVQIRAASAYLLNWQLAADQTDYLNSANSPTLVQHYWSLALEEQFYVVWPLLLLLAFALGRRLHVGLRTCLITALSVTAFVSFAFAVFSTSADPAFGFFATQSRAWEFALGGLVALVPAAPWPVARGRVVGWLVGSTGLAMVVVSCVVLSEQTSFPGPASLVPTVGTALVLVAGAETGPGSVLAWARGPVVWLGDHSYGVYLWHWPPIIALPWVINGPLGDVHKVGILATTLLLAWLTKRYVEDPVHSGAAWQLRRWASVGLAIAAAGAVVLATTVVRFEYDKAVDRQASIALASLHDRTPCYGAAALVEDGCKGRFAKPSTLAVSFAAEDVPRVRPACQLAPDSATEPTWCQFGDLTSPRSTIALVGNSYAVQLVPLLLEWTKGQQVRILLAARTNCLGLSAVAVTGQEPDDPCLAWSAHVQARLLSTRNLSLVVLSAHERSDEYLTGQQAPRPSALASARRNVLGSLRMMAAAGIPTLVVKHAPGTRPMSAPECVALSLASSDPCALPRASVTEMDFLSTVASRHPGVTSFVSLDRYFCTARKCHAVIGGVVAYSTTTTSVRRTRGRWPATWGHSSGRQCRIGRYLGPEREPVPAGKSAVRRLARVTP